MIFDTHTHYDDDAFQEDRDALIQSLLEGGIEAAVDVASSYESLARCLDLAHKYKHIYCALGIHPDDCGEMNESWIEEIREMASDEKVVAIGEIGLDYYWKNTDPLIQQKWFVRQLQLAKEVNLPVIIHSREAAADTMKIMKENHAEETGGVVHCYSYSKELAREYVKMGFYIGVGGVITFKNARKLVEVVEDLPLDRIVLETDCPYLAPVPYRGKRNSSLYLPYVVEKIAQIKNVSEQEVIDITRENAVTMYRLK